MSGSRPAGALAGYLAIRTEWSRPRAPHSEPWRITEQLTAAMDAALATLPNPGDLTVVAVGGYGNRQLILHSDIDLLLLHDGAAGNEVVRPLLYPLWDAGLKVGHSLRTFRESLAMAREDITVLCSLLSARLITGPPERLESMTDGLVRVLRNERSRLSQLLAAEESGLWGREPFLVQSPDLKESRGGLRTLDRIRWDRQRSQVLGEGAEEPADETIARKVLLSARTGLHAVTGRAFDRYDIDLRVALGEWLDREPLEVATEIYQVMDSVDCWAGARFGRLRGPEADPVAAAGRGVMRFVRDRWSRQTGQGSAATALSLARRSALTGNGRLSSWEIDVIRSDDLPKWTEEDRIAFLSLLASGQSGWEALRGLWVAGWVDRALPELSHLRGLAQAAPFHQHPAHAHLGRTVAETLTVAEGAEPWCGEIAEEIGGLDELLLSAFLHDAGKGLAGEHAVTGAVLATSLLPRLGFPIDTGVLVSEMVRHHLLLPEIAFRRDLDDPAVIRGVASALPDLHSLRILTLLTVADARATGDQNWNQWRSGLLRTLYGKVAELLRDGTSHLESQELLRLVELVKDDFSADDVHSHIEQMPAGYILRFGSHGVAAHLRLIAPGVGDEVRVSVIPGAPVSTVMTATNDQPGLLALISGVLSLHNLAVLEARVTTRADGVAIDTFRVGDGRGGDMIGQARWPGLREDLRKAISGEIDVAARLAQKRLDYPSRSSQGIAEVSIFPGEREWIIEVRAEDRIGLLHDLASSFARLRLDVRLAKIDTRGNTVIDVFTVAAPDESSPSMETIRSTLAQSGVT